MTSMLSKNCPKVVTSVYQQLTNRCFSSVILPASCLNYNKFDAQITTHRNNKISNLFLKPLLQVESPSVLQKCDLKVKGKVRRRCHRCFLVWRGGLLHVDCPDHGRHKQVQKKKFWKDELILTHATGLTSRRW